MIRLPNLEEGGFQKILQALLLKRSFLLPLYKIKIFKIYLRIHNLDLVITKENHIYQEVDYQKDQATELKIFSKVL